MKKKMVGEVPSGIFLKKENQFVGLDYGVILADWEAYYREIHGLKTDFAGIRIPRADDNDFPWFICRPEKFFAERAYSGGVDLYPKRKWTKKSLDDVLDMSFGRDGKANSYIIRVHDDWKTDNVLANLSANQIAEKAIDTACLTERLLLGDFFYWKHKRHLDVKNATLCSGSRDSDGDVPFVDWFGGKMNICWCDPDCCFNLCSRVAIF